MVTVHTTRDVLLCLTGTSHEMSFYFRQEIKCGKESSEHKKDQGNRGASDEREFIEKE